MKDKHNSNSRKLQYLGLTKFGIIVISVIIILYNVEYKFDLPVCIELYPMVEKHYLYGFSQDFAFIHISCSVLYQHCAFLILFVDVFAYRPPIVLITVPPG